MEDVSFMDKNGLSIEGAFPAQSLEAEALFLSGLSRERAFAIDNVSISKQVDEYFFNSLAHNFYARVYADKDESFRALFAKLKWK